MIIIPSGSHRDRLPSVAIPYGDASLWSVLKQVIGKELSKITMPIQFNEPLSCNYCNVTGRNERDPNINFFVWFFSL